MQGDIPHATGAEAATLDPWQDGTREGKIAAE